MCDLLTSAAAPAGDLRSLVETCEIRQHARAKLLSSEIGWKPRKYDCFWEATVRIKVTGSPRVKHGGRSQWDQEKQCQQLIP